ncbi:MAG: hypothetical protein Q8T08_09580 [Ignavibacteria bacterium]|nr:hypothetical protein [Ignavibacteria bacterium]
MTVEQLHEKYGLDKNITGKEWQARKDKTGSYMHPTFNKHKVIAYQIQEIWMHVVSGNMTSGKACELTAAVIEEYETNKNAQEYFKMQQIPKRAKRFNVDDEEFSVSVLVFNAEDPTHAEIGFYDFDTSKWSHLGDTEIEMICWCYMPDPTDFLKDKDFKPYNNQVKTFRSVDCGCVLSDDDFLHCKDCMDAEEVYIEMITDGTLEIDSNDFDEE